LADASSRPTRSPRAIDPAKALLIFELRRRRMIQARIARSVGVSASTVSRVLARAALLTLQAGSSVGRGSRLWPQSERRPNQSKRASRMRSSWL
jgi:hypothetical protein